MPHINTVQEFGAALKQGPYAWPGGYPLYFVTSDGGSLSFATAWNERAAIARAIIDDDKSGGWKVIGYDVNWENADLTDDHTGNRIESAYAEDDAVGETDPIPKSYNKWYGRVHGVAPVVRGPKIIRDLDGLPNGKAKGKRAIDFDLEQLKRGAAVEREHTSDPKIAQRIAMDHLVEDPRYYEKLAKIHLDGLRALGSDERDRRYEKEFTRRSHHLKQMDPLEPYETQQTSHTTRSSTGLTWTIFTNKKYHVSGPAVFRPGEQTALRFELKIKDRGKSGVTIYNLLLRDVRSGAEYPVSVHLGLDAGKRAADRLIENGVVRFRP